MTRPSCDVSRLTSPDDFRRPKKHSEFLASDDPNKRQQVIDTLLRSPDYADYFANKWTALLKNRRDDASDITSNFAFHAWIRDSLLANVPYDQLVRELLAATGTVIGNPAVAWYKRVKEPKQQMEDVAQLFLGVRMQCAQCHHHPFERWSQDDYYGLSAFFSQVGRKPTATRGEDLIFHQRGIAATKNIKTGQMIRPAALGDDVGEISADEDPRLRLADWMSGPENPFFAKALVNRYWKHFFNRGLIEPEDDIRDTNPPTNPELLDRPRGSLSFQRIRPERTRPRDHRLSRLPVGCDAQRAQRRGHAELFALLSPATAGGSVARRDRSSHRCADRFCEFAPRHASGRFAGQQLQQGVPFPASLWTSRGGQRVRVRACSIGQPRAEPALDQRFGHQVEACHQWRFGRSTGRRRATACREDSRIVSGRLLARANTDEIKTAEDYFGEPRVDAAGKPVDAKKAARENFQDLLWALINTKEFLFNH